MALISGKYEIVESKNYYEMLLKFGVSEEAAKKSNEAKSTYDVEVDGNKIRVTRDSNINKNVTEFVLNEAVDEIMSNGPALKSTATQNGNVVTIESKQADGSSGWKRILTFSSTGLEMKIVPSKDDIPTATRIYKRL